MENKVVVPPLTPPADTDNDDDDDKAVYQRGLVTIAFITLLFASNSPALHAAFSEVVTQPPVFLLNAACSMVAMVGMLFAGPFLDDAVDKPSLLQEGRQEEDDSSSKELLREKSGSKSNPFLAFLVGESNLTLQGGVELGVWKFLGTVANMYGLSQTSAGHGAFLIQLTTLFVPLAQGIMGVPIPQRIWTAIALALSGVFMFTQDGGGGGAGFITAGRSRMCGSRRHVCDVRSPLISLGQDRGTIKAHHIENRHTNSSFCCRPGGLCGWPIDGIFRQRQFP